MHDEMTGRFGDAAHLVDLTRAALDRWAFFAKAQHRAAGFPRGCDGENRPAWWSSLSVNDREIAEEMIHLGAWEIPE